MTFACSACSMMRPCCRLPMRARPPAHHPVPQETTTSSVAAAAVAAVQGSSAAPGGPGAGGGDESGSPSRSSSAKSSPRGLSPSVFEELSDPAVAPQQQGSMRRQSTSGYERPYSGGAARAAEGGAMGSLPSQVCGRLARARPAALYCNACSSGFCSGLSLVPPALLHRKGPDRLARARQRSQTYRGAARSGAPAARPCRAGERGGF